MIWLFFEPNNIWDIFMILFKSVILGLVKNLFKPHKNHYHVEK